MINRIIFILALILITSSCEEASTIDPFVKKTILNPKDTSSQIDNRYKLDRVEWYVIELYNNNAYQYDWSSQVNIKKSVVMMDTTLSEPKIWVDLEIESTLPSNIFGNRLDRVSSFRIEIDSSKIYGAVSLSHPRSTGRWTSVSLIEQNSGLTYEYKGEQLRSTIFLTPDYNNKIISGIIPILLPENLGHETTGLNIFYTFYY